MPPVTWRMKIRRQEGAAVLGSGKVFLGARTQGLDAGRAESEKESSSWREEAS